MMKLYHTPTYRSARVTWLIEELGAQKDFEVIHYNPYKATEEEVKWYKENVQCIGQVPGFVLPNGEVMTESGAISMYLAEKYNQLLPDDKDKPAYLTWIFSATSTADVSFSIVFAQYAYKEEDRDSRIVELHLRRLRGFIAGLEHHLDGKSYICGDKFTVADIAVGYTVLSLIILERNIPLLQDSPRVRNYFDRLYKRPAYIKGVGTLEECTEIWIEAEKKKLK